MTATSPYRSRPAPISTISLPVVTMPRRLAILLVVLVVVPALLHVLLWSRVVTVRCLRDARAGIDITCEVDEASIALSNHARHDLTGATLAVPVGDLHRSRGDVHLEVVVPGGPISLTSGFNGDKAGQARMASELTRFFQRRDHREVTLSFGDRWRTAWIFIGLDLILALALGPVFGQRLRVTADRERDTLEVRRRVWPLRGERVTVPLSRVARTPVVEVRKGRYQLVALTLDQETFPLTWTIGAPALLEHTAAALERFLEQERAR